VKLPGEDLVQQGISDLRAGEETIASLLVSVGCPRLLALGFELPESLPNAEHRLYFMLSKDYADAAHSQYNALIRRLVSFERAAESAS